MLDSLVRVTRRVTYNHYVNILTYSVQSSVITSSIQLMAITLPEESYIPSIFFLLMITHIDLFKTKCITNK